MVLRSVTLAIGTLLAAVNSTASVQNAGNMLAEIGVHHIRTRGDIDSTLIRRGSPRGPASTEALTEVEVAGQSRSEAVAAAALSDAIAAAAPASAITTADIAAMLEHEKQMATPAAAATSTNAYADAVLASHPVAYWQLAERTGNKADAQGPACGQDGGVAFGDMCSVAGRILGTPTLGAESLIPSNSNNKAIKFDGRADQEIVIPDSAFINTNDTGYDARTVELWFKAGDLGGINRTIYEEGNAPHSGINIYAREAVAGSVELYMYSWDRGNGEIEYGTPLINPFPIKCTVEKNQPYYAAFVFSGGDLKVSGYIKGPSSASVELCGEMSGLPQLVRLRHHGHGGGNAIIGGVQGTARATGMTVMDGTSHNFIGTIDEVAVYNRALPQTELQSHVAAAGTSSMPAPAPAPAPASA